MSIIDLRQKLAASLKVGIDAINPDAALTVEEIADMFEYTYVIDLRKYMPIVDEFYRKNFKLGSHENAMGYQLFARVVMTYIDYIIRKNTEDFIQIGFVGTEHHNMLAKW